MKIKWPLLNIDWNRLAFWRAWPRMLAEWWNRLTAPLRARLAPLALQLARLRPVGLGMLGVALTIGLGAGLYYWHTLAPVVAMPAGVDRLNITAGQQVLVWYALGDPAEDMLIELVDEFNASNPWSITVVPQAQGSYQRLRDRLDSALARGASPDLAMLYPYHTAAYAARDHIVALDDYIDHAEYGLSEPDDFIPAIWASDRNPHFGNQLLSFPVGPDVMVLVYNLDWLRSLGFQGPPLTWGAFKEACGLAKADTNGDGQTDTFGWAFVPDAPTFAGLVLSRAGQLLSPDGRQVLFNTPEGEKALRTIRDNFEAGCAYSASGREWDRSDFIDTKALFNLASSSALPAYRTIINQESTFRWGVAALPHNTATPITPLHGLSWTVLRTTPQRQLAAWLFIRWFSEKAQTQRWAATTYTLPLRRSALLALRETPDLDPVLIQVLGLAAYAQPEPVVAGWEQVNRIVVQKMQAVAGGQEPKEALEQAQREADLVLREQTP